MSRKPENNPCETWEVSHAGASLGSTCARKRGGGWAAKRATGLAGGSPPRDATILSLPSRFAADILTFAPVFVQQRSWGHAEVLLIDAILAPGQRTMTSLLRIVGLSRKRCFVNYHRVLNRAVWNSRAASRLLLGLLIAAFVSSGTVVLSINDTIERRRGKRITAKGIDRDPARSSHGQFVKASGLRWLSLMLLAPISWAGRV